MALNAGFLRRQSRFPQGISTGGGETGFKPCAQPTILAVELTDSNYKEVVFPAGTLLIAGVMLPKPPASGEGHTAATGGDIKINLVTGGEGGSLSTEYVALTAVEAYSRTVMNSGAGYQLTAETRIRFTAASLLPATTGVGRMGVEVVLPTTKA